MKLGAASAAALTLPDCTPDEPPPTTGAAALDPVLLQSVGEVVVPAELGADGRERVVSGFETWLAGYEPVPELMHGYGSQEIRYGPPHPAPRWASQLAALDLEARKRWSMGFAEADAARRREMVRLQLSGTDIGRVPTPTRAEHIATALLSYWLSTPDATNRCYGRAIDPRTCRPLAASRDVPAPLSGGEA